MMTSGCILLRASERDEANRLGVLTRMANPARRQWVSAVARGKWQGVEPPESLFCCGRLDDSLAGGLIRYAGGFWVALHAVPPDDRLTRPAPSGAEPVTHSIALRQSQEDAIEAWRDRPDRTGGVIVAPCGAGKTHIGVHIGCTARCRVLIVVNSNDLVEQWRDRIASQTDAEPIVWRKVGAEVGRFTIATLQFLATLSWHERHKLGLEHGLLIVDECHRIPARTFAEVVSSLPCTARLGLTATPDRHDGLGEWIRLLLGDVVHTIRPSEAGGLASPPLLVRVDTGCTPPGEDWGQWISALCLDSDRNDLIKSLATARVSAGGSVLILSDRVAHCEALAYELGFCYFGDSAEAFHGGMSKKKRRAVLDGVRDGAVRIICATKAADEGLDLPRLDTLILACPTKNKGAVEQRIGRIMRDVPGKLAPVVYDMVDAMPALKNTFWARMRLYKARQWPIVDLTSLNSSKDPNNEAPHHSA